MIDAVCLFLLLLIAPFEPRLTVPIGSFHISLVEAVAVPCFAVIAFGSRSRDWRSLRARPLLALGLFALVSLVSASLAAEDPGRAFRFALRLSAMSVFAALVARMEDRGIRWGIRALAISGSCAAILAVAEGLGLRSLDVFLGAFREIPFNVAGIRRASAGSEYPNLGAAMIVYALLASVTLSKSRPWFRGGLVVLLTGGLAFTYSRGAWVAGLAGLLVVAWFERGRERLQPAALYLGVLGLFVGRAEISQIRFSGENANDFYSAAYDAPPRFVMAPSERILVPVTVRNVGRRPWRTTDQIHLSYHLYRNTQRPLVDGPRTDLPRDVEPGESVTLDAILRAPSLPGEYLVLWDLVHEDTTWFSGQGVKPGVARLLVGTGSSSAPAAAEVDALKAIPDILGWRPSRLDLWKIALRMWAENPFFGVGPDNFRWMYGTTVGKPVFDTRVFANNMYLEFAATLGALGLAAFCAALGFALLNGWQVAAQTDQARIALSILIAISVHGLADYLLAFTGHYLVFGFAVGILSRIAPLSTGNPLPPAVSSAAPRGSGFDDPTP